MNKDTRLSDVLHVLLHLGHAKEPITSEVLARSMGTNPAVFRRTMAGLRAAGHVSAEKGHGGGWLLARPLHEISLLDVYVALGRPTLFAFGNRERDPGCQVQERVNAVLADSMAQAEALFVQRFAEVSLAELAPKALSKAAKPC
ncbi:Rrf2 family transcriptional regulator [Hydrogenophaga luteola]|uniref:Rrf2 family transcriptional regulator n=1 Tax=Hydrogenophaga luteola TaxID=1591122 RepID=A0ABV7W1W5_9BURK